MKATRSALRKRVQARKRTKQDQTFFAETPTVETQTVKYCPEQPVWVTVNGMRLKLTTPKAALQMAKQFPEILDQIDATPIDVTFAAFTEGMYSRVARRLGVPPLIVRMVGEKGESIRCALLDECARVEREIERHL